MEFSEKLQKLRKSKGLTQEELADSLYVSRTAVSKWESGRGYPNIDSLLEIAKFFSVTVDDLLSGEKLISIAERENKENIVKMCDLLLFITDLFWVLLFFLPLYPNKIDEIIYSVSLFDFWETSSSISIIYLFLFSAMIIFGVVGLILTRFSMKKGKKFLKVVSFATNIFTVAFLVMTRMVYATVIAFLLLIIKIAILIKQIKIGI